MSHSHSEPEGEALVRAARSTLERAGEQWTGTRAAVFAAAAGFDRPASAYDIADAVSQRQGKRMAPNSVYRILELFEQTNLVRRVESANAYIVNAHPSCAHDCIFLVCDACGRTTHVDDDHLSDGVRQIARRAGFDPVRPVIEVRGRCEACAAG